jgi:hypothetical protein
MRIKLRPILTCSSHSIKMWVSCFQFLFNMWLNIKKITIDLAFFLHLFRILRVAQVTQSMPAFMYLKLSACIFIRYQVEVCGMCEVWGNFAILLNLFHSHAGLKLNSCEKIEKKLFRLTIYQIFELLTFQIL